MDIRRKALRCLGFSEHPLPSVIRLLRCQQADLFSESKVPKTMIKAFSMILGYPTRCEKEKFKIRLRADEDHPCEIGGRFRDES